MEPVKPRDHFFEVDPRMSGFVVVGTVSGTMRDMTIDDHYGYLQGLDLNPGVPESVVSYMNIVKNLFLYAWLNYPFFTVCQTHAAMAVELALRLRMPNTTGKEDKRTLRPLLEAAIANGLIRDAGFPGLAEKQAEAKRMQEEFDRTTGHTTVMQSTPYVEVLLQALPRLRNHFAHPHDSWIVSPAMAWEPIRLAVEIINQLWP
jgi:hypothetical protein